MKADFPSVLERLRELGYRVVGPRIQDGAIVYDDLESVSDLPVGYIDEQDGGHYRLRKQAEPAFFDYVVGPHSLKQFLFLRGRPFSNRTAKTAVGRSRRHRPGDAVGRARSRSCDLHALAIQDRVFLGEQYADTSYQTRRENLLVIAVNCRRAAPTCFCHSMKTGPAVKSGFDLALTEMADHFVVEVGSESGGHLVAGCDWSPCAMADVTAAKKYPAVCGGRWRSGPRQHRSKVLPAGDTWIPRASSTCCWATWSTSGGRRWRSGVWRVPTARSVCPTCFCSAVEEISDLTGDHVHRQRIWASCFTAEHSYMNSGSVRKSTASRYRQWLTHKLASWIDQFGTSGCTGCGRCITWCPVGIDLTEEVAAIRGDQT